jgi:hypothetical protein
MSRLTYIYVYRSVSSYKYKHIQLLRVSLLPAQFMALKVGFVVCVPSNVGNCIYKL